MRSYKGKDEFFRKMNKKPAVQAIVDNIDDYTVEDLENLKGRVFPKWIREALVKYKNRGGMTPDQSAEMYAAQMLSAALEDEDWE